jgi:uncharacterized membrane protein (DUF485 family)
MFKNWKKSIPWAIAAQLIFIIGCMVLHNNITWGQFMFIGSMVILFVVFLIANANQNNIDKIKAAAQAKYDEVVGGLKKL